MTLGVPSSPVRFREDRLTALSYIWSDEPERVERTRAALAMAAEDPPEVAGAATEEWLPGALAGGDDRCLTVIWQSVVPQYVDTGRLGRGSRRRFHGALRARGERALAWLCLEPSGDDRNRGFTLSIFDGARGRPRRIAGCGYHGPAGRLGGALEGEDYQAWDSPHRGQRTEAETGAMKWLPQSHS